MTTEITIKLPKTFDRELTGAAEEALRDALDELVAYADWTDIERIVTKKRLKEQISALAESLRPAAVAAVRSYFINSFENDFGALESITDEVFGSNRIDRVAKAIAKDTDLIEKIRVKADKAAVRELEHQAAILGYTLVKDD